MSSVHPNVHQAWQKWSEDQTLHLVAIYSNPLRFRSRREQMHNFRQHMAASRNVMLHTVEMAYGHRPWEVTEASNPLDLQLRCGDELWHKENLINLGMQRLPVDWQYAATLDTDFHMTRPDWALEAIHQLQHHAWVQLFSSYSALSADNVPVRVLPGFAYSFLNYRPATSWKARPAAAPPSIGALTERYAGAAKGEPSPPVARSASWPDQPGSPGGGWAFTRAGYEAVGGFLETCILGSADTHMAFGLAGEPDTSVEMRLCTPAYRDAIANWQRGAAAIQANIGVVENHAIHYFHGSYKLRGYGDRWQVLRDNAFDPHTDLRKNSQGILVLAGNKPRLRDDIRAYFRSRNEDSCELVGERRLV